jgi:hypothetical protein
MAALFTEVMLIRWQTSVIPILGYFKNLPLIVMFLGMGAGCLLRPGDDRGARVGAWSIAGACMLAALSDLLGLHSLVFPDPAIDVWDRAFTGTGGGASATWLRNLLAILAVLAIDLVAFTWFGRELGRLVGGAAPLRAYAGNILGSLAGVVAFAGLSWAGTPPVAWAACAGALLLACGAGAPGGWRRHTLPFALVAVAGAVSAFREASEGGLIRWSPYYRVKVGEIRAEAHPAGRPLYYRVDVNRDIHQVLVDTSLKSGRGLRKGSDEEWNWKTWEFLYDFPYLVRPHPDTVLIGGAGGGNDASAALRNGAVRVTAVEIDPLIAGLGRSLHPARPYADPRVRLVNDDIRGFLSRTAERYDLITYGILDSHTALSSLSSLRLENYVYTVEGIRGALARLVPGGVMTLSFYESDRTWLGRRLYANILAAGGREPAVVRNEGTIYFAFGPGLDREAFHRRTGNRGRAVEQELRSARERPTTDDWPFLYTAPSGQPVVYYITMVLVALGGWMGLRRVMGRGRGLAGLDWEMAFLGAGFMLVQVRALTSLTLVYGSTWTVNAGVMAGILALSGAANAFVAIQPVRRRWVPYVLALAAVMAMSVVPPGALLALGYSGRAAAGTLLAVLPVLFSGMAFSAALAGRPDTASALGSNLVGCVFGGALEAVSLVWGIGSLSAVAAMIYVLAWRSGAVRKGA